MSTTPTLGHVIAERRAAMRLSLKELGQRVLKENGEGVSAQYLHDIERDRRTPSLRVLGSLAGVLGVDPHYLTAVAGLCPPEILAYLRSAPSSAAKVAAFFEHARATGFADWDALLRQISPAVVRKADEPIVAAR